MNPRNNVNLLGRIPDTDKIKFEFREGSDEAKNLMFGSLSVRRAYKKSDEQYYSEDLIPFRAFGKTATYINQYVQRGDTVCTSGELRLGDNYEKDGKIVYGTVYFLVENVTKINGKNSENQSAPEPEKKKTNPLLNRKRSII